MVDSTILDKLNKSNLIINKVVDRLDLLKYMFIHKVDVNEKDGKVSINGVDIKTIHNNENSNIIIKNIKNGAEYPDHLHQSSMTFIIVSKGRVIIKIGDLPRVMRRGDCASVGIGIDCSLSALEDSEVIAVCIPPEEAYNI